MQHALALAARGVGAVEPNPPVGAVVVDDQLRVLGEGWHQRYGGPHAEVFALEQASAAARGATLFVTLEPCCHFGKTPPCSRAVIAAGLQRVVVAMTERNAALPQATNDPEFIAGATYRDIRRGLAVTWPEVRDAVQDLRVHAVLQVARFFGRFGPVFVISDYGVSILEALDAEKPLPEPPDDVHLAIEAAKVAYEAWTAGEPSNDQPRLKLASEG